MIFIPLSSFNCWSGKLSTHSGGSFPPPISTIFDCTVTPKFSPSNGVTSAYQNSSSMVKEGSIIVKPERSVKSIIDSPSKYLNQDIKVPDSIGCSTSK